MIIALVLGVDNINFIKKSFGNPGVCINGMGRNGGIDEVETVDDCEKIPENKKQNKVHYYQVLGN